MSTTTYVIELQDRPGALERLLNTCRRKRFDIQSLQFGHAETPDLRRVVVTFTEACPPAVRVVPNLAKCHDVVAVEPVAAGAARQPTPSRVHAA